jgi:hypothetical protein
LTRHRDRHVHGASNSRLEKAKRAKISGETAEAADHPSESSLTPLTTSMELPPQKPLSEVQPEEYVAEQLRSSRDREESLLSRLSVAENGEQNAQREMRKALSELHGARVTIQRQKSSLEESEHKCTLLIAKLKEANKYKEMLEASRNNPIQGRYGASATGISLRNGKANDLPEVAIPLDVFDSTVDQVPEVHAMDRVCKINDALEALLSDVVDETVEVATAQEGAGRPSNLQNRFDWEHQLKPILSAMTAEDITEANRGLLLQAILHHIVIERLYDLIFRGEVAAITVKETAVLNEMFVHVSKNGA